MGVRNRVVRLAVLMASAAVLGFAFAPAGAAAPVLSAVGAPAGVNDMSCRPSAAHPEPVVLVHGSGTDVERSFGVLGPAVAQAGYCVFAADIGKSPALADAASGKTNLPGLGAIGAALNGRTIYGVADIPAMARDLAKVVQSALDTTGAQRVALVGHSTGGTIIRQYLRTNGAASVSAVVTLGSPYRGSTWAGLRDAYPDLASLGLSNAQIAQQVFGAPGQQQLPGSPFLTTLNAGGETVPGVRYTAIASRTDEVITPNDTALLSAAEGADRNIWIQDGCPTDTATHSSLLVEPRSLALVLDALGGEGRNLPC
ncbi:esterase/lipase family protein [Nocardia arthritidis]|nr:alpha/beta fold hydrolase [Nocardia arthritidis]